MITIAIDLGVKTGLAVYDHENKKWLYSGECTIFEVYDRIKTLMLYGSELNILLEDARQTHRPKGVSIQESNSKAQGAGWIKTLCGQFENLFKEEKLKYKLIKPSKAWTKKDNTFVELQTGRSTLKGKQNERDAIMMLYIYGLH